jgi:hypothetical protein
MMQAMQTEILPTTSLTVRLSLTLGKPISSVSAVNLALPKLSGIDPSIPKNRHLKTFDIV